MVVSKQKLIILLIPVLFFLALTRQAIADDVEIGNLVINRTITKIGIDFFEAFSDRWSSVEGLGTRHIRITEAPSARWGSMISVWVGEEIFFRIRLSSRAKNIDVIADQAVQQIMSAIAAKSIQDLQGGTKGDLAEDEL